MKSTGIVRRVDELGRIVLPIELRRSLNINERDTLEIFVDDEKIVLKNMNRLIFLREIWMTLLNIWERKFQKNLFLKWQELQI